VAQRLTGGGDESERLTERTSRSGDEACRVVALDGQVDEPGEGTKRVWAAIGIR
jgi:hypothetical protein